MTKVLICGSVNGDFVKLQQLVQNFAAKGKHFDALLCCGETLSLTDLKLPDTPMPCDTYFVDSSPAAQVLMNSSSHKVVLGCNIQWLGRAGILKLKGLTVAYVSGLDSDLLGAEIIAANSNETFVGRHFVRADIDCVLAQQQAISRSGDTQFEGVDILLTCQWPLNITKNLQKQSTTLQEQQAEFYRSSETLQLLVQQLNPRYIYSSAGDAFVKPNPFKNSQGFLTRFIGLGTLPGKYKPSESRSTYIQAIELSKFSLEELQKQAMEGEGIMENPYETPQTRLNIGKWLLNQQEARSISETKTQAREAQKSQYSRDGNTVYVGGFDCGQEQLQTYLEEFGKITHLKIVKEPRRQTYAFATFEQSEQADLCVAKDGIAFLGRPLKLSHRLRRERIEEDKDCWFCIANPSVDRNLIIKEMGGCYLAMPKGPVVDQHFLIVPNEHLSNSLELTPDMGYQRCVDKVLNHIMEDLNLEYILFERNIPFKFQKAAHMNTQIIGIPSTSLSSGTTLDDRVRKLLKTFTRQQEGQFLELPRGVELADYLHGDASQHFFYLEIPGLRTANGRQRIKFVYSIKPGASQFDMQFGRVLACHLLGQRDKINWKNCEMKPEEQATIINDFKKVF